MQRLGQRSLASVLLILLNVTWYAVAAVLVIAVALVVAGANVAFHFDSNGPSVDTGPNVVMRIPVSFTVDAGTHAVRAPSLGIERAQLEQLRGWLRFPPRRDSFFATSLALLIGALAWFLWVLTQLRGLLRTLRDGRPFVPANAARVRRIGWALIVGEIARSAIVFFESVYVMRHFSAAGLTFDARPDLNTAAIISGLIILLIAEVFREGARLEEDRSLTI